jgi:hypothetical protein
MQIICMRLRMLADNSLGGDIIGYAGENMSDETEILVIGALRDVYEHIVC